MIWALGLIVPVLVACDQAVVEEIQEPLRADLAWNEVFGEGQEIPLELPAGGPKLLQIRQLETLSTGELVIPDSRARRILVVRPDGTLVRVLRGGPDGDFPLSILGTIAVDPGDSLWIFDPDGRWLTVLEAPKYRVIDRFQAPVPVASFLVMEDGSLIGYSPTEKEVFHRFSPSGRHLKRAHGVRDEELRLFHSRVQTGGLVATGDVIFGIHPAAFELVELSPELEVMRWIRPRASSSWHPAPLPFPTELSPYDHTPAHEDWWNDFDHIGTLHALDGELLVLAIFSAQGLQEVSERLNIYRVGDEVQLLAKELRIPNAGRVVGADGKGLYVVQNARMTDVDSLSPLRLLRYPLARSFSAAVDRRRPTSE